MIEGTTARTCFSVIPTSFSINKNGDSAYLNRRSQLCGSFHDHPSNGLTHLLACHKTNDVGKQHALERRETIPETFHTDFYQVYERQDSSYESRFIDSLFRFSLCITSVMPRPSFLLSPNHRKQNGLPR